MRVYVNYGYMFILLLISEETHWEHGEHFGNLMGTP
jgi:hypothetical protein